MAKLHQVVDNISSKLLPTNMVLCPVKLTL